MNAVPAPLLRWSASELSVSTRIFIGSPFPPSRSPSNGAQLGVLPLGIPVAAADLLGRRSRGGIGPQAHDYRQFGDRRRTGLAQSLPDLGPEAGLVLIAIVIVVLSSIPPLLPLLHVLAELFVLPQCSARSTRRCSHLGRRLPLPRLLAVLRPLLPF